MRVLLIFKVSFYHQDFYERISFKFISIENPTTSIRMLDDIYVVQTEWIFSSYFIKTLFFVPLRSQANLPFLLTLNKSKYRTLSQ